MSPFGVDGVRNGSMVAMKEDREEKVGQERSSGREAGRGNLEDDLFI